MFNDLNVLIINKCFFCQKIFFHLTVMINSLNNLTETMIELLLNINQSLLVIDLV